MSKEAMRRYTAEELRDLADRSEGRTDPARLRAMSDEGVECAIAGAGDPDWDGVPDDRPERAEAVMPKPKVPVSTRLDADLVEHFRAGGRGRQTRVNAILRACVQSKKSPAA